MKNHPSARQDPPANKRARLASLDDDGSEKLPCEVWAAVCEFVNFSDLLNLSLVSRFFLHHVMHKVRSMNIRSMHELHVAPVHRFRSLTDLYIRCFVQEQHEDELKIDTNVAGRILPFVSRLPKLELLFIGGYFDNSNDVLWYDPDLCRTDKQAEVMRDLFRTFSGAFASGLLSDNLLCIMGLKCPNVKTVNNDGMPETCNECEQVLTHFPINYHFQSFETALRHFGTRCGVTLCKSNLEIFKAKMTRPDSDAMDLCYYVRFLLAQGHLVKRKHNKRIVDYSDDLLNTFEYICSNYEFPPLRATDVLISASCSYMEFTSDPIPPLKKRFIVKETLEKLIALGIPLSKKDFRLIGKNEVTEI